MRTNHCMFATGSLQRVWENARLTWELQENPGIYIAASGDRERRTKHYVLATESLQRVREEERFLSELRETPTKFGKARPARPSRPETPREAGSIKVHSQRLPELRKSSGAPRGSSDTLVGSGRNSCFADAIGIFHASF